MKYGCYGVECGDYGIKRLQRCEVVVMVYYVVIMEWSMVDVVWSS